ncbi:MAG: universal stress protein [Gaiellales bacterium]|nr:universal stress protein [Gaiellales bacterium]
MIEGKFVVASDGSESAKKAERYAAELAACLGLPVDVVNVIQVGGSAFVSSGATLALETELAEEIEDRGQELREALKRVRGVVRDQTVSVTGHLLEATSPARAIVEYCSTSAEPIAAVVLGNRGTGGFPRLLMGSVSDQVVKTADCPVIVVKA